MEDRTSDELPWEIDEGTNRLSLTHQHLWLGIFGIPFAVISACLGVAIWFVPGVSAIREWPILSGGSIIASGFVVMGLHLTFNREQFIADQSKNELIHRSGFGPFIRTRRFQLSQLKRVQCVGSKRSSSMQEYELNLVGTGFTRTIAIFVEKDVVLWEGIRWSSFLDLPFDDETNAS